jgi:hypothetical protein
VRSISALIGWSQGRPGKDPWCRGAVRAGTLGGQPAEEGGHGRRQVDRSGAEGEPDGARAVVEVVEAQVADPRGGLRVEHDEKSGQAVLGRHGVVVQQAAS